MSTVKMSALRRRAAEQGYSIWKVRSSTREFWEFGPYALITDDGIQPDDVAGFERRGIEVIIAH